MIYDFIYTSKNIYNPIEQNQLSKFWKSPCSEERGKLKINGAEIEFTDEDWYVNIAS